jgi:hypothetical protein
MAAAPVGAPPRAASARYAGAHLDALDLDEASGAGEGGPPPSRAASAPMRSMAPPSSPLASPPPAQKRSASASGGRARKAELMREPMPPSIDVAPYRARLAELIATLERALDGGGGVALVRLPVERLGELLEDLVSIGAGELAGALAPIVERLRGALGELELPRALAQAIAELRQLLAGTPPPAPRKSSRWAFWK